MTPGRGDALAPIDDQVGEGVGPKQTGGSASDPGSYDMNARWHRYKLAHAPAVDGSDYWAALSERLLFHPALTGRLRHRALVVEVWASIYMMLMASGQRQHKGYVDPHELAALLDVSTQTVRRGLATLVEIGAVTDRRIVGRGPYIYVRLDNAGFGRTRTPKTG